jgi:predicted nucleic acid-binding protein
MAGVEAFLDSNVLLYALSDARTEIEKRNRAADLIGSVRFGISYQVLMETWSTATRKFEKPVAERKVLSFLELLSQFPGVEGSFSLFRQAWLIAHRYQVHPYDAAIIAAAQQLEAPILYSEDMNHGQDYGGVKVINPFLREP